MLQQVDLDSAAISFLRSYLASGYTLARYLAGLPLETGRVITYLTPAVVLEPGRRFDTGGVVSRAETEPQVVDLIGQYLRGPDQHTHYAVFEDAVTRPGDPVLQSSRAAFVTYGSEVYYILTPATSDPSRIIQAVRQATSHRFVGILAALPGDTPLDSGVVTTDVLMTLAQAAEVILIDAFDGEGYLIWLRP